MAVVKPTNGQDPWGDTMNAALDYLDAQTIAETTRAKAAEVLKLAAASNLSDLGSAVTARTNLGVDASGASRPPSGAAGGDLTGTYPSPNILAGTVGNAKLSTVPALTLKGNNTGGPGTPLDLTVAQIGTMLGVVTGTAAAAGITYDPTTSGLNPIPEFDVQGALDWLARQDTIVAEQYYMKLKKDITDLLGALAGSQTTAYAPGLRRTDETVTTVSSGAAVTLTPAYSNGYQVVNLTAATPAITLPTATVGQSFVVLAKQDATGGRAPTWVGTVTWAGGSAPVITVTALKADEITFRCYATGTWTGNRTATNI